MIAAIDLISGIANLWPVGPGSQLIIDKFQLIINTKNFEFS